MIKEVKGFTISDGRFFETKSEAELEEAKSELTKAMEANQISLDALEWVEQLYSPILKYLLAKDAHNVRANAFNSKRPNLVQQPTLKTRL